MDPSPVAWESWLRVITIFLLPFVIFNRSKVAAGQRLCPGLNYILKYEEEGEMVPGYPGNYGAFGTFFVQESGFRRGYLVE